MALAAAAAAGLVMAIPERSQPFARETIRIGYAVEAPYAFLSADGQVTGESPEVAKRIAARLGIRRIDWIQTSFDALIPALESHRIDVVAAGMFITPERGRRVAFSAPAFHARPALLVRKGNPRRQSSYQDAIADPEAKVAVIAGAIEETLLGRMGLPQARTVVVPDALTGRIAVATGLADGLALSAPTIRWMTRNDSDSGTEMAEPFAPPPPALVKGLGYGGFAFRKQDAALRQAWNAAMAELIASAEHRELVAGFGFTADELPGSVTTEELLTR